ncbi:MAG: IclR family transcriptional regulator [Pyramidobacter sp.]|jgi:DNA-binding IclR family transcriptional regulator
MIQSLKRAMSVLEYMAKQNRQEYSIAEISPAVKLPPSTVYRVLQTFLSGGYVLTDPKTHLYRLGPGLIALARAAGGKNDLAALAMPYLQRIAGETGDDAFLMVISGFQSHVVAKADGPNRIKIVSGFEANSDLHCGANRKMLLAFQSDRFIEEYIGRGLKRYTSTTITNPQMLREELETIREEKTSFSLSEFIEGAMGVSAPVFGRDGRIAASIGTSGPAFQVTSAKISHHKKVISECAAELSALLGYEGGEPVRTPWRGSIETSQAES